MRFIHRFGCKKLKFCAMLFVISGLLSACGFHLRGLNSSDYKFPFTKVYVECNGVAICSNLNNAIKIDELAKLMTKPESADVVIKLANEQTSRDAQGFSSVGRISAFLLTYQVDATLWHKGLQLGNQIHIKTSSTMQYNDSTILSNNQNEVTFWDNLHENATQQLIRRIVHFQYSKWLKVNNAAESR